MTNRLDAPQPSAFSRRITFAIAALGAIAAVQGAFAIWAVAEAERHVMRGRVAGDIKTGFLELSVDKQRLRNLVAQQQFGVPADAQSRKQLLDRMRDGLALLKRLALQAEQLDDGAAARIRQAQRRDALLVLDQGLEHLGRGLASISPPAPGADAAAAWSLANELFDRAKGSDLKRLLADSMDREATALREKRAQTDEALDRLRRLWITSTTLLVLMALALAASFARALRRPLLRLTEGVAAIRAGELSHRIPLDGTDEFSAVARSMNAMAGELADRRKRETDARQALEVQVASRTAELSAALEAKREMEARRRQLFADISHELRTPTTAIRGEAQVTLRGGDKPLADYKIALQRIEEAAHQLGHFIDDLLTMARSDIDTLSLRRGPIDLVDVLNDAVSSGAAMAGASGLTLAHDPWPAALAMQGDADRLRQLLLTLIDNAIRYSHPGQTVRISAHVPAAESSRVEVRISDQGIGIPQEELSKVFSRNYRAPNAVRFRSNGSGLGLSIARNLARGHGGDIVMTSETDKGTTAILTLPLMAAGEGGDAA